MTIITGITGTTSSSFTLSAAQSGAPSADGYITIKRGSSPEVSIKWSEGSQTWQLTNDGIVYADILSGTHNTLPDLQGGGIDGYYHITAGEHAIIEDGYNIGQGWYPLPLDSWDHDGYSTTELIVTDTFRRYVRTGMALRIWDRHPSPQLYFDATSDESLFKQKGYISYLINNDGGGGYHLEIWDPYYTTQLAETVTYYTTDPVVITAVGGSNVTGTFIPPVLGALPLTVVSGFKYNIASEVTVSHVKLRGHALSLGGVGDGYIGRIWYGAQEKVVQMDMFVPGPYAAAQTATLLADGYQYERWCGAPAHLVAANYRAYSVDATYPIINITLNGSNVFSNTTIDMTDWIETISANNATGTAAYNDVIEITQQAVAASANNQYLNINMIFILE